MDCVREVLGSKQLGAKIVFLSLTNVLIGLWIAFALSYFETKHRLDAIEYQHRLVIKEIIRLGDSTIDPNQLLFKYYECQYSERQKYQKYLLSMAKIDKAITKLDEIKRISNRNDYLDRSGRSDYALETSGAQVLSIGNTELATPSTSISKWLSLFGLNKISKYFANGPNRAIQPSIHPGECFAFTGPGEIIIKLIKTVFIDAVSIEHILPQMSPNGNISNAPSNFSVYGMENGNGNVSSSCVDSNAILNAVHLGDFQYDINKHQPLQLFQLNQNVTAQSFPIVRFIFKSNHGDPEHTCVYRIRVHGSLTKPDYYQCDP